MSVEANNMISQDIRKEYCKEAAEETKELSQGDNEWDGADNEFDKAWAEENAFEVVCAERITARARSQRARNMAGYATETAEDPEEEEEK